MTHNPPLGDRVKKSEEEFVFNVYKINRTGFKTSNPITWAAAIEHYCKTEPDVSHKWLNKKNDNGKITHARIHIWYNRTTPLTICINYVQGLFLVEGPTFKNWIQTEFLKVTRNMNEDIRNKFKQSVERLSELEEKRGEITSDISF